MNPPVLPRAYASTSHHLSYLVVAVAVISHLLVLPSRLAAHTPRQDQQTEALGSLSNAGQVFVNEVVAPPELTIFPGDAVRTGETGVASFTASGKGTLKLAPNSLAVFSGSGQYVAELRSGTVLVSSLSGPAGLTLRVGDFLLVPAVQDQQTTARVERSPDGSASIACLEGSLSVISLQGAAGVLLQANQSTAISATGQLVSASAAPPAAAPPQPAEIPATQPTPTPPTTPTAQQRKKRKQWVIVGLAGGGAAVIIAAAAGSGGGHHPVSPASP